MSPPDLMHSDWRCPEHGPVLPFRSAHRPSLAVLDTVRNRSKVPLWCLWPLLPGWTVTGVGWVGDERSGARATAVACSGPAPLEGGPADVVLVAEELGVGLGPRFAGLLGADPGPGMAEGLPHAKVTAAGHPTPLWAFDAPPDRSAYVGEAKGFWLYAVAWPATAGYVLAEEVVLHDLVESLPSALVFGAPSPYLHGED
ncbi:hypothetical protein Lfu02_26690 [Longispora fulva]|nr:hypothetical protein Lfu02_26690 [Longispora fulva]